jgi:hypothetical protein
MVTYREPGFDGCPVCGRVLAITNKSHPKGRWQLWIAKTLQEQFKVDVVVCENPFRFSDSMPVGPITQRELSKYFRNDWIIKIKLDGRKLKRMLLTLSNGSSSKKPGTLVINGQNCIKSDEDCEGVAFEINSLRDYEKYTVALPYSAIDGQRLGVLSLDYKIVGEGHLVPLLRNHLSRNNRLDIDSQLAVGVSGN